MINVYVANSRNCIKKRGSNTDAKVLYGSFIAEIAITISGLKGQKNIMKIDTSQKKVCQELSMHQKQLYYLRRGFVYGCRSTMVDILIIFRRQ